MSAGKEGLQQPPQLISEKFSNRLAFLAGLPRNWDGEGADPISGGVVARTLTFAEETFIKIGEPTVIPAMGGSLQALWEIPGGKISTYFDENQTEYDTTLDRDGNILSYQFESQEALVDFIALSKNPLHP